MVRFISLNASKSHGFFLFKNSEREKIELNRVEQKRAEKPLRRFCLFVGKDEL
jgi:hypothetical protein